MNWKGAVAAGLAVGASWALAVQIGGSSAGLAQQPPGGGGGGVTSSLFTLLDTNKDGALTRDEMKSTFDAWYTKWDTAKGNALTAEQMFVGMSAAFPPARQRRGGRAEPDPASRGRRRDDGGAARPGAGRNRSSHEGCSSSVRRPASCTRRFRSRPARSKRSARRPAHGRRPSPTTPRTSTTPT